MATREATIAAEEGLHARPAAEFVQAVRSTGLNVTIAANGKGPVFAGSILQVLKLGARKGDTVTLSAEGDGAETGIDMLVTQLETSE